MSGAHRRVTASTSRRSNAANTSCTTSTLGDATPGTMPVPCALMRLVTFHDPHGTPRTGRLDGERVTELAARTMLDWLRGDGHEPTGRDHALTDVLLVAPLSEPPSV